MTQAELDEVLRKHKLWLEDDPNGERAELSGKDLSGLDLNNAKLDYAKLNYTVLNCTELNRAKLNGAKLNHAKMNYAEMNYAEMNHAELYNAKLYHASLNGIELSGCKGLLSPIDFLNENFEKSEQGYIAYKCFSGDYSVPEYWEIKTGSIIEEEVNPNRTELCGCGINVATLDWVKKYYPNFKIYKLLIKWEWLPGVVVPYNTDGKFRCSKAMILEEVK